MFNRVFICLVLLLKVHCFLCTTKQLSRQRLTLKLQSSSNNYPSQPNLVTITSSEYSYFNTKPDKKVIRWEEVFHHIAERITWENDSLNMLVLNVVDLKERSIDLSSPTVLMLVGINNPDYQEIIKSFCSQASAVCVFGCSPTYEKLTKYGDYKPGAVFDEQLAVVDKYLNLPRSKQRESYKIAQEMWSRKSSGDLVFMSLVLIDCFSTPVPSVVSVTSTDNTGLKQLSCMCANCADEMLQCLQDESCRKALDCLNSCKGNDQVCAYRCITSYESPLFQNFALCILQKHNCMGNSASIPSFPNPAPIEIFRGQPVTFDTADSIFVGHLAPSPDETSLLSAAQAGLEWSWKVVCGQNPAYDYFSCQHQIFYRTQSDKPLMWYDPVFKVETFAGVEVWRRRHYRVRRGNLPGQYHFSVLDNGVVSSEFWRILDCADDLSWAVFYYAGAAAAAGTSYTGALVVSPDGSWPVMTEAIYGRLETALGKAGIKMWEVYEVNNIDSGKAGLPPLGVQR